MTTVQKLYPIYDQNGWKLFPLGVAHTYMTHIRKYPPGSCSTNTVTEKTLTENHVSSLLFTIIQFHNNMNKFVNSFSPLFKEIYGYRYWDNNVFPSWSEEVRLLISILVFFKQLFPYYFSQFISGGIFELGCNLISKKIWVWITAKVGVLAKYYPFDKGCHFICFHFVTAQKLEIFTPYLL